MADQVIALIKEWRATRNNAPDRDIYSLDAYYAEKLGLPALAALLQALDQVRTANPYVSREEVLALLRPVLSVAVGEGSERILIHSGIREAVPGVPTIPQRLLERDQPKPEVSE